MKVRFYFPVLSGLQVVVVVLQDLKLQGRRLLKVAGALEEVQADHNMRPLQLVILLKVV
jgi:hypothetical protein